MSNNGNKNILLVTGEPNTGKSTSLYFLRQPERYVYLNTDMKETPFRSKFAVNISVDDPLDILDYMDQVEDNDDIDGVIVDTLTFMMDMYESMYIHNATDSRKMWGEMAQFYKAFIRKAKAGTKTYIILAHENIELNEKTAQMESKVPIKGAIGRVGAQADFTTVVSSRNIDVKKLKDISNDLLEITEEEEADGIKRIFLTRSNKEHTGSLARSAIGLWEREEIYIDNNIQQVLDRINTYYN